jgi:hypothetical protein
VRGQNLVIVILDSLRFDSWLEAAPKNLGSIGPVERRWSYASWTAPSHFNLLMGLLPHTSPPHVYASDHYKADFARYSERLGIEGIEFKKWLPSLYLPTFLKHDLGYRTEARVSMPVLNPYTILNHDFDHFELMSTHNDMMAIVNALEFDVDRPRFHLINSGETHYPYALPNEDPSAWPHLPGLHGVLKCMDESTAASQGDGSDSGLGPVCFDRRELDELRGRQISALQYVDGVFGRLFDVLPTDTWLVVTSDHGELFGEDGYFGHGPVAHEKVYEVPFVEGLVP